MRNGNLRSQAAGGASDRLSRVESVKINGEVQNAATYTFVGLARYVKIGYAEPGVDLTYIKASGEPNGDAGDPYTGYDRFGRTVDMRWQTTGGSPAMLDRYQWGYDRASNRTWRENLVAPSGQDEHYAYDPLYQVIEAARGDLNINRTAIGAIPAGEQRFDYDPTGNWLRYITDEDGVETLDQSRVHNRDNQMTQLDGSNAGILYDRAGNALKMPPDAAGNWSEHFRLTWDAWNRLVTVSDSAGQFVAAYAYDGLFRRIARLVGAAPVVHTYYNDLWRPVEDRVPGGSSSSSSASSSSSSSYPPSSSSWPSSSSSSSSSPFVP